MVAAEGVAGGTAVTIEVGKSTPAPWGGPLRLHVVAAPARGGHSNLSLKIVGQAGEVCNSLVVNGRQPSAPTFVMASAEGRKVESGAFQFG